MDLTDAEMVTLGIGGAVLIGTCVIELPVVISVRLLCFALGIILLAFAIYDMVAN